MGDGDTMDIGRSEQAQLQHSASMAGQDLHQRQVDHWQHSPVLRSVYQNQYAPFPSVPVEIRSQQQHKCINQPSHQTPAGVNECPIDSLSYDEQPAVQATPTPSSSGRFPLDREQYLDEQFRQMREASDKYFDSMNRLMELQYQAYVERMKTFNQQTQLMFSLCWAARALQPAYESPESSPISTQQQETQHQAPFPNDADSTAAVINEEQPRQPRVDQLFVPVSTFHRDEQQQQKQAIKNPIVVPAPHDDSSDEVFEHAQQNECAAEVFKSSVVGSLREEIIISDKRLPMCGKCTVSSLFRQSDPKFVQYFLDRHGHRMDLARGRASVFSDVFEWMINQREIRIKLRSSVHQCLLT
ncbi:uncharacterized protein LOC134287583 [Aedes albopictus]|uniref:Uncharacterized protein n=1 Tax=Aedes albopictus TaxID=7160 RepID=A0ABM1ZZ89_AEDAL